nr:MAG TPA: hypothetical protein [Caudoviricetes sp.]
MGKLKASIEAPKGLLSSDLLSDREVRKRLRKTLQKACEIVRDHARQHHWYSDRSGSLSRSFKYRTRDTNDGIVGTVYQDERSVFYGKFQIEGTGIYGKKKQQIDLNKYGNFRGYYWIRRRRWVRNPLVRGIRPRDILGNAYSKNKARIAQMFKDEVKRIAGGMK